MRIQKSSGRSAVIGAAAFLLVLPALLTAQAAAGKEPEQPQVVDKGSFRVSAPPGGSWKTEEEQATGGIIFRKTKGGVLRELTMQERKLEVIVRSVSLPIEEWRLTEEAILARIMDRIEKHALAANVTPVRGAAQMGEKPVHFLTFKTSVTGEQPNVYSTTYYDVYSEFKLNAYYAYYFPPDFRRAHRFFEVLYGSYLGTDFFRLYKNPRLEPLEAVVASLEIVDPLQAIPGPAGELIRASAGGNIEAVQRAVDAGADVNVPSPGLTPLAAAALNGHRDVVEFLLGRGANIDQAGAMDGCTALHQALAGGEPEIAKILIGGGCAVNPRTNLGFTPLMLAAGTGETGLVAALLERGADANAQENEGKTALLLAGDGGTPEMARLLVAAGADLNAQAKDGSTALMHALLKGNLDAAKELLDNGADVKLAGSTGWTALMFAALNGTADLTRVLIEKGADVNARTQDKQTALMKAAESGAVEVVKLLIANGADVGAKDAKKLTALKIAKGLKHKEVAQVLQAARPKG